MDSDTIYEFIRDIKDPEFPQTLEELGVINDESTVEVDENSDEVTIRFHPTVPHCGMAPTIGLCLRVRMLREFGSSVKVNICLCPGSHNTEADINKQLNDKERVAAAMENPQVMRIVEECLKPQTY